MTSEIFLSWSSQILHVQNKCERKQNANANVNVNACAYLIHIRIHIRIRIRKRSFVLAKMLDGTFCILDASCELLLL